MLFLCCSSSQLLCCSYSSPSLSCNHLQCPWSSSSARAAFTFPLKAVQQLTLVPVLQLSPLPAHQEPVEPKLQLPLLLPESVSERQPFPIPSTPQEPAWPPRRLTPLPAAFSPPPQVFNLHHSPAHFHQYSCLSAQLLPHQSPNLLHPVVQPPEQLCTLGKLDCQPNILVDSQGVLV